MKRVLYLTNIEVPYRVRFFNELSSKCDLTVLYERKKSTNRDESWASSEPSKYMKKCFEGINIGNESAISFRFLFELLNNYDVIIVGCYNSPVQILSILLMRLIGIRYFVNIDGNPFLEEKNTKTCIKKLVLKGADKYIVAGKMYAEIIENTFSNKKIIPYYFSSLSEDEISRNATHAISGKRNKVVLVIGQYFEYKGMDIALQVAKYNQDICYKFIGMGNRTELFCKEQDANNLENVEIIPFVSKEELAIEYKTCAMLVLPSRQECWGLVINEAASYGIPIVSTWGSGAAVEFLAGSSYECFLAKAGDADSLYEKIVKLFNYKDKDSYVKYLLDKSKSYSIQKSVEAHLELIELSS